MTDVLPKPTPIRDWIKTAAMNLITEKDNVTVDFKRVMALVFAHVGVGLEVWAVHKGQAFAVGDFFTAVRDFFVGVAAVIGAHSLAKGENGQ